MAFVFRDLTHTLKQVTCIWFSPLFSFWKKMFFWKKACFWCLSHLKNCAYKSLFLSTEEESNHTISFIRFKTILPRFYPKGLFLENYSSPCISNQQFCSCESFVFMPIFYKQKEFQQITFNILKLIIISISFPLCI